MKTLKVIIYDCDGVLINSRESNRAFYNHILSRFGLPPLTPEQLDFVQVSTAQAAIQHLFEGTPYLEEAQACQRNLNNRPFLALMRLEPHVREVLEEVRPSYRTAIATNRGKSLPLVLEHLGLKGLFDFTVTCYDVSRPKPHPECLLKILNHFKIEPEEALFMGDAPEDALVSRRAGIPFAAYKNPRLKARYHLEDHLELLKILGRMA